MTESLWNKYDTLRKLPEVQVKHSVHPKWWGKRVPSPSSPLWANAWLFMCTEDTVGFHCDGLKNMRVGEAGVFIYVLFSLIIIGLLWCRNEAVSTAERGACGAEGRMGADSPREEGGSGKIEARARGWATGGRRQSRAGVSRSHRSRRTPDQTLQAAARATRHCAHPAAVTQLLRSVRKMISAQLLSPCNDCPVCRIVGNLKRLWFCVSCSDVAYAGKWNCANSSEFVVTLMLLNRKVCADHVFEQTWKYLGFWHLLVKCHRFYWNWGKSRVKCLLWISGQKLFISSCTFVSIYHCSAAALWHCCFFAFIITKSSWTW